MRTEPKTGHFLLKSKQLHSPKGKKKLKKKRTSKKKTKTKTKEKMIYTSYADVGNKNQFVQYP